MQGPSRPTTQTEAEHIADHLAAVWRHFREFSHARFDVYLRDHGPDPGDACACYLWNVEVRAALLPTLDAGEVLLRNSIDLVLVRKYGEFWFDGAITLEEVDEKAIARAWADARRKERDRGRPTTHHDVVVEIGFRFWANLLKAVYADDVWTSVMYPAFPNLPKEMNNKRKTVRRHFVQACDLRNRVCHGERVIHNADLPAIHDRTVEAVGWMSLPNKRILLRRSKFGKVWEHGQADCKETLLGMIPPFIPPEPHEDPGSESRTA